VNYLRIYGKLLRVNALSTVQYKGWWIMILQVAVGAVSDPIGLILMFSRFGDIGVWSVWRMILIYALAVASFGLAESFNRGFDYFPWHILRTGDFDRNMLRPAPLFIQIAGARFHIHRLARAVSGLGATVWALAVLGTAMDPLKIAVLALALLGGFLMYTGVFILTSGIAFFTVGALDWIYILENCSYQVTRCPVPYMPRALRNAFTFLMPLLVVSYYPASYICGWGAAAWQALLALPAGLLFLLFSMAVWRVGVRHYQSTGN